MYRPSRDEVGAIQALTQALRSTCGRRLVGAYIAKDGRPISSGYAGPPSGEAHCDAECLASCNANGGCHRTIHAEQNAIAWAARYGRSTEGATLYTTLSPCRECAKLIINSGIIRVVYLEEYRNPEGISLLRRANIPCETLSVNSAIFTNLLRLCAYGGSPQALE